MRNKRYKIYINPLIRYNAGEVIGLLKSLLKGGCVVVALSEDESWAVVRIKDDLVDFFVGQIHSFGFKVEEVRAW